MDRSRAQRIYRVPRLLCPYTFVLFTIPNGYHRLFSFSIRIFSSRNVIWAHFVPHLIPSHPNFTDISDNTHKKIRKFSKHLCPLYRFFETFFPLIRFLLRNGLPSTDLLKLFRPRAVPPLLKNLNRPKIHKKTPQRFLAEQSTAHRART